VFGTTDLDAACRFATDVLGLPQRFRDGDRWAQFDAGGIDIAFAMGDERPPGDVALAIKVDDVPSALARALEMGARLIYPPMTGEHETRAAVSDAEGRAFVLYAGLRRPDQ
jgi:predicted enzyme related to lactoylglutathione lyase